MRKLTMGLGVALLLGALGGGPGHAASPFCVTCLEPAATYRCQVDKPGGVVTGMMALQLYCITELARAFGHGSCSVRRRATGACDGALQILTYGGNGVRAPALSISTPSVTPLPIGPPPASPGGNDPPAQVPGAASAGGAPASPPRDSGPPKTVAEMAKRAASSSKQTLSNAGKAVSSTVKSAGETIGGAAKKSWNCVTSLFQKC